MRLSPRRLLSYGMSLAALFVVAGCAQPAPEAPDTHAQDEATIRTQEKTWSDGIATKDVDKFVANYAPDAVVLPPNAPMSSNPADIRKAIGEMLQTPGLQMTFTPSAVSVAKAGDMAYSYGTYNLSATGPDGKPMADKGKYVTIYKKQADGMWKAVVDTFNSDMPMTPPAPEKKK